MNLYACTNCRRTFAANSRAALGESCPECPKGLFGTSNPWELVARDVDDLG